MSDNLTLAVKISLAYVEK